MIQDKVMQVRQFLAWNFERLIVNLNLLFFIIDVNAV